MKTLKTEIQQIKKVVKTTRLVSDRINQLQDLGFNVHELPMGPGGVLQQKKMKDGSVRVQIGYGHGKYNYAMTVIL